MKCQKKLSKEISKDQADYLEIKLSSRSVTTPRKAANMAKYQIMG
jgi:hypothetical protein